MLATMGGMERARWRLHMQLEAEEQEAAAEAAREG